MESVEGCLEGSFRRFFSQGGYVFTGGRTLGICVPLRNKETYSLQQGDLVLEMTLKNVESGWTCVCQWNDERGGSLLQEINIFTPYLFFAIMYTNDK